MVIAQHARMVIDAARIFRCAHTYVVVKQGERLFFVCASCEYKTDMLPLRKPSAKPAERVDIDQDRGWLRTRAAVGRNGRA